MVKLSSTVLWKNVWQFFRVTTALLLISACSSITPNETAQESTSVLMDLQAVPEHLQNRVWLEKFNFSFMGDNAKLRNKFAQQDMLLQTELGQNGINLAAMSFTGIMLAQAQWQQDHQQVHSELGLAKNFDAKKILHDLQLVNWPISLIQKGLFTGFTVNDQINTNDRVVSGGIASNTLSNKTRRFYRNEQEIIIVQYQQTADGLIIKFEQLEQGYQLMINRLTDKSIVAF